MIENEFSKTLLTISISAGVALGSFLLLFANERWSQEQWEREVLIRTESRILNIESNIASLEVDIERIKSDISIINSSSNHTQYYVNEIRKIVEQVESIEGKETIEK